MSDEIRFSQLAVGERFKFAWSGYVGTKTSARKYTWHSPDGKDYQMSVGSVSVPVIRE